MVMVWFYDQIWNLRMKYCIVSSYYDSEMFVVCWLSGWWDFICPPGAKTSPDQRPVSGLAGCVKAPWCRPCFLTASRWDIKGSRLGKLALLVSTAQCQDETVRKFASSLLFSALRYFSSGFPPRPRRCLPRQAPRQLRGAGWTSDPRSRRPRGHSQGLQVLRSGGILRGSGPGRVCAAPLSRSAG